MKIVRLQQIKVTENETKPMQVEVERQISIRQHPLQQHVEHQRIHRQRRREKIRVKIFDKICF